MKKSILFATILLAWVLAAHAQTDTMYVMRSGVVVKKYYIPTQIDSVIFYKPNIESSTVTDYDGNEYNTVIIGSQVWMAENLRTTHYADGTDITYLRSWSNLITYSKAFSWYDDDLTNKETYGALYTWAAAINGADGSNKNPSGIQGVCPTGWHLPSDAEWTQMANYLADNGYNYDGTTGGGGDKIGKSLASTSGWVNSSNTGTVGNIDYPKYRNKTAFTALPGGYNSDSMGSVSAGYEGIWWSATAYYTGVAWCHSINSHKRALSRCNYHTKTGISVRCVKD